MLKKNRILYDRKSLLTKCFDLRKHWNWVLSAFRSLTVLPYVMSRFITLDLGLSFCPRHCFLPCFNISSCHCQFDKYPRGLIFSLSTTVNYGVQICFIFWYWHFHQYDEMLCCRVPVWEHLTHVKEEFCDIISSDGVSTICQRGLD